MKRHIEAEYFAAVAKRTRAGTERFLVEKLYGKSGVPNRKKIARIPDVEMVRDGDEAEAEAPEAGRKKRGSSGSHSRRGKEWADDIPEVVLVNSPLSVGDDDGDDEWIVRDEGVSGLRNECGLDQECVRKGKGKWVEPEVEVEVVDKSCMSKMVEDDEIDRAGVALIGESESVLDNYESNGSGKNRCLGGKDVGDSVGSRTGFQSPAKPYVDSEETLSVGCTRNSEENESAGASDGNVDVILSENESETDVSSTDSQDSESDEDFDEHAADVSSSSEFASDSDAESEQEKFTVTDRGGEESCGGKHDDNASPCCSDDVVILHETVTQHWPDGCTKPVPHVERSLEKETEGVEEGALSSKNEEQILGEDIPFHGNDSCIEPVFCVKESIGTNGTEEVRLSAAYEVEILGKKVKSKEKVCCSEPAPLVEGLMIDGTKGMENVILSAQNKEDKLDEKGSFTEKGSCAKSAPTITEFKVNKTKAADSVWIVCEENSNHSKNESAKCFRQTQEPAKDKPKLEATFAWDGGTVRIVNSRKTPSQKNRSFVEPTAPTKSSMMSKINEEPLASDINGGAGCSRGAEDNLPKDNFGLRTVPHITATKRSHGKLNDILTNQVVSKSITDDGGGNLHKEKYLNDCIVTGDGADGEEQQEEKVVLQKEKCKKPYSRPRFRTLDKIDAFDVLYNSLIDKRGAVLEDIVNATDVIQEEENAESAPKSSLPQYFTFGVEKPVQVEKSEHEQELDNLWDEFQFAIRTTEIGCPAHEPEKIATVTASKVHKIYPTFCNRGEHKLALDDEIGIRCLLCSFVQLEIKYMIPDWAKLSSRKFDRRASSDDEEPEMFDGMQFHNSEVGESSSCSDGTVWDLIVGVKDKLYPHQRDGFEFIWVNLMGTINLEELRSSTNDCLGGCIISHAPGTGKTRLTIEFLLSYLELFSNSCPLIIAPAGMLLTWEAEFKKWGVGIPFHNLNSAVLSGKEDTAALNIFNATKQSGNTNLLRLLKLLSWKKQKSILGLSYSLFEKLAGQTPVEEKKSQTSYKKTMDEHAKEFGKIILEHAGLLVLDEGHTPRNPRSRIYKALTNIQTKKRIILSGTPFQNNLAELYTILSLVRPDFAQTISQELKKFCQKKLRMVNMCSGRNGSEPDVGRDDREAILQLRCKIDPFVHVHKGSVLQESLPGLKDCVIVLNPPQYQKQIVEQIESNSYTNFEFEHKLSLATIHPSLLLLTEKDESVIDKAVLEACRLDPNEGVKTRFLFEMIRLSEGNNEKVLVFSQYLDPLGLIKDQICSLLHWHEGKEVLQLVGRIEQEQRQTIINVFNDPRSSAKVLLASTKACSEGINLVGASRVVLLDVVWNPSVERQAISRAFRLGQKKVVYSYNLIVGRMEWEKYGAQTSKEHVSNLVFFSNDEPDKRCRVLSEDKILEELITHSTMEDMFDQIVYHPKESMFS